MLEFGALISMRLLQATLFVHVVSVMAFAQSPIVDDKAPDVRPAAATEAFDGVAAYDLLKRTCDLGPRASGTKGMLSQQAMLTDWFQKLGGQVALQKFTARHPLNGQLVEMANLGVRWHSDRKKRILLCCHYDTRPFPDSDKVNPRGVFVGANDGASGVGLLGEFGRHMSALDGKYGVDMIFFDGEELVYVAGRDPMFLGSQFFAQQYANRNWDVEYQFGILVDMVGDKDLQIYYEGNSLKLAGRITKSLWAVAKQLEVKEFIAKQKHMIRDDHLALNDVAKIPTCDIIDFDYPNEQAGNQFWHTEQDTPDKCSAESLEKVGKVLLEWLRQLQKL